MATCEEKVYLIHFETKLHHAGHYLGYTKDLDARIRQHQSNTGAKLLRACNLKGIRWSVVRVWKGGRALESALKASKNAPKYCPVCLQRAHLEKMGLTAGTPQASGLL